MQPHDWQVLIVEDEADSLELMQMILQHEGIASTGVNTAEQALALLPDIHPTIIIVDLALPTLDGWGFLQRLKEDTTLSSIPKVAITAFHTPILASKAIAAGFDAFFPKPIDAACFVQELNAIVAEKLG